MDSDFSIREILSALSGVRTRETTPYVYVVSEISTGVWYVGCRTAKGCHPSELGRTYFTSSRLIRSKFRETPANYRYTIVCVGGDALKYEHEILTKFNAKESSKFYNMHNGGGDFDGKKAATLTYQLGIGVHARSKEKMSRDSKKMVGIHRPAKTGIFSEESRRKWLATQRREGIGIYDNEAKRRGALKSGLAAVKNKTGIHAPDFDKGAAAKRAHLAKYMCTVCGMVGAATSMGLHQKASKHNGKRRIVDAT